MKPAFWLRLLAAAVTLMLQTVASHAQNNCKFSDDFSTSSGWTQVGSMVTITSGAVKYQNGAPGAEQRRVYKNIGVSLAAGDTWSADIDFTPISVGDYGGPHAGHAILSLTAGTQEPFSNCPDVPCTGYPPSQQDGVVCFYGSPGNPSDGNSYFLIYAIEGSDASEYVSPAIVANALQTQYFVRLERVNATSVKLSVFSDVTNTIHLPGSPVVLNIPASIEGLNTVQHGNVARGGPYRALTGEVDNLCINWQQSTSCPPDRTLAGVAGSTININTGVDENLNVLPFGVTDPRWYIVSNTLPPMQTLDRWNFTPVTSQWIGFDNNQGSNETNYKVRFTFCTEKCGYYRLNFRMLADNGACVYLDGALIPSSWWASNIPIQDCTDNPGDQSPFIPTAGYLIDHVTSLSGGMHTLEIDVTNFAGSLTSINIQGEIEAVAIHDDCPCPPDRTLNSVAGSRININTGVDENLDVLPFGVVDPRWTIVSNTLPPMSTLDRWNFSPVTSQWIGFDNNQGSNETNYKVRFTFCVEHHCDYRLNFRMLADNGACVYLDGALIPSSWWANSAPIQDCTDNPGDQSPFIPTAGYLIDHTLNLLNGIHTLDIDVTNFAGSLTSINIQGGIEVAGSCFVLANDVSAPPTDLRLFPNPAQDQISVTWKNAALQRLRITDVAGRVFRTLHVPANTDQVQIPLDGLQPGIYFLTAQDDSGRIFSKRFVKMEK